MSVPARRVPLATWSAAGALLLLLVLPIVVLVADTLGAPLWTGLDHPLVGPAVRLTLITTSISLAVVVVFGTALAWRVARARRRTARVIELLVQLPIVVPPAVAGLALLLTFGDRGPVGAVLSGAGIFLPFSVAAVVLAEVFVSTPFYVQGAIAAFRRLDEDLLLVARSLGAGPTRVFFRIVVPLAWPGLISAAGMAWARAVGEFGATLMFAGNLSGTTQTMPLAIYAAMESDLRAAQALAVLLIGGAIAFLVLLRLAARRAEPLVRTGASE